jgi:hypothetical protein
MIFGIKKRTWPRIGTKTREKDLTSVIHRHFQLSQKENHNTGFEESLFILCSEHCKGDKQMFIQLWQSYNSYWKQTQLTNASTSELQFLDNFMNKYIQNVEYFVDVQRTYLIETFHNLTTKYPPKKTSYSFKMYIMRKTLVALYFNEIYSNNTNTFQV